MSAFLGQARGEDPYAEIRVVLCKTYELRLEQKLDAFLASSDLGDERPAEYALELRRLLTNATLDDVLKRVFIRPLPKSLINAISGNLDHSFDSLVEAAEKAWAHSATVTPGLAVNAVQPPVRGKGARQQGSLGQDSKSIVLCPFQVKWGVQAKRCLSSCSRWDLSKAQQRQVFHVEEFDPSIHTASEN